MLLAAPSEGTDGRGPALSRLVRRALRCGPWRMSSDLLRSSLAVVATNGKHACGEASRHNTVDAFSCLFQHTRGARTPRVHWDHFHHLDHAGTHAIRSSVVASGLMQLLHDLESAFGFGQGRELHRGVNDFLQEKQMAHKHPGGARKFVYLADTPRRFLAKFRSWVKTVEVRRRHRADEGFASCAMVERDDTPRF